MLNQQDMWTYRPEIADTRDLDGFDVVATDGGIGEIDSATYDVGGSWIVVDTGPWILGRKVVLPASTIERIDLDERDVYVGLTKGQIKDSPEYDPDRFDEDYRTRLTGYYTDIYLV